MKIIVQKYGGTSLASIEKIKQVAKKISHKLQQGYHLVVVVSAMGETTDHLLEMAGLVSLNPSLRELDVLLTTGEQQSTALLSMALWDLGNEAISLQGYQVEISTTGSHGKSRIEDICTRRIKEHLASGKVVIIPGFQGINNKGDITTLGRGGSDTTAIALAVKLKCPCEIYTDVEGIFTVDPRLFQKAKIIRDISYETLAEMAALGAKVMDERAIELGRKYAVPIYIAHSKLKKVGTYVGRRIDVEEDQITAITLDNNMIRVIISKIPNIADHIQKLFNVISGYGIEMGMVQSEGIKDGNVSISFISSSSHLSNIELFIEEYIFGNLPYQVEVVYDETRVSLIGTGIINQARATSRILEVIESIGIKIRHILTSERSLSFFINKEDAQAVVKPLAEAFKL